MLYEHYASLGLLIFSLALFMWGRIRFDVVAVMALILGVFLNIIPAQNAFEGFGHPAVVTVLAVLIISRGLDQSGIAALLTQGLKPLSTRPNIQLLALTAGVTFLSGFMNNVGSLALMLPVGLKIAQETKRSPSEIMMPLAFGSLLGGLMTLIGTPTNIIVSTFRAKQTGEAFALFDFLPVGGIVAVVGVVFITLIGWRLIPKRAKIADGKDAYDLKNYLMELKIPDESPLAGGRVRDFEPYLKEDGQVLMLIRGKNRFYAPRGAFQMEKGDVVLVEGLPAVFAAMIEKGLVAAGGKQYEEHVGGSDLETLEVVVRAGSKIEGSTAASMRIRQRFGVNLLALSRHGRRILQRIGTLKLRPGDILLLQGESKSLREVVSYFGLLPLEDRELNLDKVKISYKPIGIFLGAIALSATGLVPTHVSFILAILVMILLGQLSLKDIYDTVEWPVIVLLGAMIPVGQALQTSGTTDHLAEAILHFSMGLDPLQVMTLILIITMIVSDFVNNSVTAVVMAPIAYSLAMKMGANPDAFLMTVAIGSSSAFLTPIGHQSNTLVMGPGEYQFRDYARLGIPLELLMIVVTIPAIYFIWGV